MDSLRPRETGLELSDLASLLRLRAGLAIVHHIPGRIRLRLDPSTLAWANDEGVNPELAAQWLGDFPGVKRTRVNAAAASLIVEYDPKRLAPSNWETLILGDDDAALALALALLGSA